MRGTATEVEVKVSKLDIHTRSRSVCVHHWQPGSPGTGGSAGMHVPEVEYNAAADDAEASAQNGRKDRRKGTGCGNHDENKQV